MSTPNHWCDHCEAWRFNPDCGRDDCPRGVELPTLCANCEDCGEPILPEYSHCDRCAPSAGEN